MAYLSINGTAYIVRVGKGRGQRLQVENRRRAIDASLLVDPIATKKEVQVEIAGLVSARRYFTVTEADALIATLVAGSVTVAGEIGSFTGRARDVSWTDEQDSRVYPPAPYRLISTTIEEV